MKNVKCSICGNTCKKYGKNKSGTILICCDEKHVIGWYLCRYEHSAVWIALMSRIAQPSIVVSDGGTGFKKALRKAWAKAEHQRFIFHIFCQIKRYIASKPKMAAGMELYMLAKDLLYVNTEKEAVEWKNRFNAYGWKYCWYL